MTAPDDRVASLPLLTSLHLALFWTQVQRIDGACWLWQGYVGPTGYGDFQVDGQHHRAHRLAYRLLVGEIPDGLVLDHLCRVRNCVRPSHLEPVTTVENVVVRGAGLTAVNSRREMCPHGHPYSGDNVYVTRVGARQCRTCNRLRRRRQRAQAAVTG